MKRPDLLFGVVTRFPASTLGRLPRRLLPFALVIAIFGTALAVLPAQTAAAACTGNAIVCENQLPGTDPNVWNTAPDTDIVGFATQISVNAGSTVQFKINSANNAFAVDIYRLGYYGGLGARKVGTVTGTPQTQPSCLTATATEIVDCGNWGVNAAFAIPSNAVSGVYFGRPKLGNGDASQIPFVVRNDGNSSAVVMKTSDATWQAYNLYGGNDFYSGGKNGRAYKLSYNRPFSDRNGIEKRDFLFSNEYPTIRFMEQNGYDMSYVTDVDVSSNTAVLQNHKVFMSVGHDEYWSKTERTNVTAARDAGLNLAFFSGNEVYWKTRFEPSQDGANTPNRTVVTYKDTWASDDTHTVQLDPVEPTPTWRDPRFGDLGFGPENSLTGTQFMANSDDLALTVGAAEGKLRLWRNTGLASMSGSSTMLADHTVGYESDEDVDNGYRPSGEIRLSTTTGQTPEYLQDYGKTVAAGTTSHHLTEYRAASGALVFGAGTIQWGWGLDANHDGEDVQPADPRIRQATVNILADMRATATTVAPDLVAATASADTAAPTTTITSPAAGTSIPQGSMVTVKGTSTDAGGQVAGVEVSVDGGASWHPAAGTTSWSYTDILTGSGANAIQVRATDDSANTQTPVSLAVNSPCPCSIFGVITPTQVDSADTSAVTLGVKFTASSAGFISGIRFYKSAANTGTHVGTLYTADGKTALASGTFANESSSGWQTLSFPSPVAISANTTYVAAYYAPNGHYAGDSNFFGSRSHSAGVLTASGGSSVTNGVYANGNNFPVSSYRQTNYYVDVMYNTTNNAPTQVNTVSPSVGAGSVANNSSVTATFSKDVGSTSDVTMWLQDPANNAVPATVSYNPSTKTATLNPTQALATSTTYTATVKATGMAAPYQWTFTTASANNNGTSCPCTLFNDSDRPSSGPDPDTVSVQLGMAFTVGKAGQINGGRFYKNVENIGTHTVALWNGSTKLATGTATNESSSGWQTVSFANPVSVAAGTTYVISYTAPQGRYDYTGSGLASAVTKGSISSVAIGGRYSYSSSALTSTSKTNYYVDPIYAPSANAAPVVVSSTPGTGATGVDVSSTVSVTFDQQVQAGSAAITMVKKSDGSTITGTVSNESQGSVATFSPSSDLSPGTAYTVSVSGAKSLTGTTMSGTTTVTFTTAGSGACPCSLLQTTSIPNLSDTGDGSAVTLGLRLSSSVSGQITGLRYYRDANNTGTHTGALWNSDGSQKLASLTFSDSGVGWQTASFSSPVSVTAGTTYVASYYAPNGHYSADVNYFSTPVTNTPLSSVGTGSSYFYGNGFPNSSYMASNYYVDVVFTTSATAPPSVTAITPADGATVAPGTTVTAIFDRAIDPTTLTMSVTAADGTLVSGVASYDSSARKATFTPSSTLAQSTSYSVSVGATSASGVAMSSAKTWSFTTTGPPPAGTAYSLFDANATPDTASWNDNGPVLVGVRFASSKAGSVTAIRYYGSADNTGTQQVYLWDNNNNQLATATTTSTTVGWRTVTLPNPIAIKANTTYVVGVYDPTGHYSVTRGTYGGTYAAGPLSVPPSGATYRYPNGYPTASSAANYWVDVVVVAG